MGLMAFGISMVVTMVVAAAVLAYVMFPHRKQRPRHGRWATEALGEVAERVRPRGPVPVHGLWVDPDRDDAMRGRVDTLERVVTVGLTRRGMPAKHGHSGRRRDAAA